MFEFLEKRLYANAHMLLMSKDEGKVFDPTAETADDGYKPLAAHDAINYASCVINPSNLSGVGLWMFEIPSTLKPGRWVAIFRNAESPAATDPIIKAIQFKWSKSGASEAEQQSLAY